RAVVRFYNKRGTSEQWIKEGKQAVKMTRLSCHRFRSNEVRLWLSIIAYNLGNLWRRLVLPHRIRNCSLTSLQQRVGKTGGRMLNVGRVSEVQNCAYKQASAVYSAMAYHRTLGVPVWILLSNGRIICRRHLHPRRQKHQRLSWFSKPSGPTNAGRCCGQPLS